MNSNSYTLEPLVPAPRPWKVSLSDPLKLSFPDASYSLPISQEGANQSILSVKIPAITKVHQPTDRVVICTFADGATTKAVCHPDDKFSLDTAISICVTKYLFEKFLVQNYHRYIKDALQLVERQKKEAERKEADERLRQARIAKAKLRKELYKMRKREEEILREAQVQALAFGLIRENMEKSGYTFSFMKEDNDGEY